MHCNTSKVTTKKAEFNTSQVHLSPDENVAIPTREVTDPERGSQTAELTNENWEFLHLQISSVKKKSCTVEGFYHCSTTENHFIWDEVG